jgi:hypothetical protein
MRPRKLTRLRGFESVVKIYYGRADSPVLAFLSCGSGFDVPPLPRSIAVAALYLKMHTFRQVVHLRQLVLFFTFFNPHTGGNLINSHSARFEEVRLIILH